MRSVGDVVIGTDAKPPRVHENRPGRFEKYEPGQALFLEGDQGGDVFQVVHGAIRFSTVLLDNRRMVSGFAVPREFFSLSHGGVYIFSAEATCSSEVLRIRRSYVKARAQSGAEPWRSAWVHLQREPWQLLAEMMALLHRGADEGLAHFILTLSHRTNRTGKEGRRVRLDMSRGDLADYLGVRVETVVRSLKRLVRNGIIESTNLHELLIRNTEALQREAGST